MCRYSLIADSGSTKTDWVAIRDGEILFNVKTAGINPFQMQADEIAALLQSALIPVLPADFISQVDVHFYGAGCRGEKVEVVAQVLKEVLDAVEVRVMSDMLGAARALLGRGRGIACILGTGANSCLYDGVNIVRSISPLGYVLGDEGSGAALGKRLVADVFKKQLPESLSREFFATYKLNVDELLQRVYREPFANRYLAGFVPFLAAHQECDYVDALLADEFQQFFVRNILPYAERELPIGFVGSIAHVFRKKMVQAASKLDLKIGEVLQSPAERLVAYHLA